MKRAILVECEIRPGESTEKLIKRFFKKCKKQNIIEEYKDKTQVFMTKSQKKRKKRLENQFLRQKEQKTK